MGLHKYNDSRLITLRYAKRSSTYRTIAGSHLHRFYYALRRRTHHGRATREGVGLLITRASFRICPADNPFFSSVVHTIEMAIDPNRPARLISRSLSFLRMCSRGGAGLLPVLGPLPRPAPHLRLLQGVRHLPDHQRVPLLRLGLPLLPLRHRQPHPVQPNVAQVQVSINSSFGRRKSISLAKTNCFAMVRANR